MREVFLHPSSEFWSRLGVFENGGGQQIAGRLEVFGIEDGADVVSNGDFHFLLGNVGLGVLLEMELTAIPRDGGEDSGKSGFNTFMGVAGDGAADGESALFEAGKEFAPMDFSFRKGDGGAEDGAFAVGEVNANGCEDGAGAHDTRGADFFVTGIDDKVGHGRDRAGAPGLKERIELCNRPTDLRGGDCEAAEVFKDLGDTAGGTGA